MHVLAHEHRDARPRVKVRWAGGVAWHEYNPSSLGMRPLTLEASWYLSILIVLYESLIA